MPSTLYSGFAIVCPDCGRRFTAATLYVAELREREHRADCALERKKQEREERDAGRQGDLFR